MPLFVYTTAVIGRRRTGTLTTGTVLSCMPAGKGGRVMGASRSLAPRGIIFVRVLVFRVRGRTSGAGCATVESSGSRMLARSLSSFRPLEEMDLMLNFDIFRIGGFEDVVGDAAQSPIAVLARLNAFMDVRKDGELGEYASWASSFATISGTCFDARFLCCAADRGLGESSTELGMVDVGDVALSELRESKLLS